MALHRNVYSFVFRGEDVPDSKDVIWIHHEKKNDLQSRMVAEIWIKNKWTPLIWGTNQDNIDECCCCGSPFVREEGRASAAMREASNIAKGKFSFSAGHNAIALADNSMAIGESVIANHPYQIVMGKYNDIDSSALFVIGSGTDGNNRKNAVEVAADGTVLIKDLDLPQTEMAWDIGEGDDSAVLPGGSSATGLNSIAAGLDTSASGNFSLASGRDSVASGIASSAFGTGAISSGNNSLAVGSSVVASNDDSFAYGHMTLASNIYSFAGGSESNATGIASFSCGSSCLSSGDYAFSVGYYNQSTSRYGFVANNNNTVTNESESAFGKFNKQNSNQIFSIGVGNNESDRANAFEVFSSGLVRIPNLEGYLKTDLLRTNETLKTVALGYGSTATGNKAISIGDQTSATGDSSQAFGNNTTSSGDSSHSEGKNTLASGNFSHAEGENTHASGINSHSEGINTVASGVGSHAEGLGSTQDKCTASGDGSHAEGKSIASGDYSHSEGIGGLASGDNSHAEGNSTTASGDGSHAEGSNTVASGLNSHASGSSSQATGNASATFGANNTSSGSNSFSAGDGCVASGNNSLAIGAECNASQIGSVALGVSTLSTSSSGELACGKYNEPKTNLIFSIGFGADDSNRQNAVEVYSNGVIKFYNVGDGNYYSLEQIIDAINNR